MIYRTKINPYKKVKQFKTFIKIVLVMYSKIKINMKMVQKKKNKKIKKKKKILMKMMMMIKMMIKMNKKKIIKL